MKLQRNVYRLTALAALALTFAFGARDCAGAICGLGRDIQTLGAGKGRTQRSWRMMLPTLIQFEI